MKSKKILFIGFIIFILFTIFVLANPYRVDENFEMGQNDIYNATNVNATNFYQNGLAVLDTNSTINFSNLNQDELNVNHSNSTDYWDGETSQADLNVNASVWWASLNNWSRTMFEVVSNALSINMSWFNNSIDAREFTLNVNHSNSTSYWDNLNSPSDINAADITDDGTYILSSIEGDLNVNHSNSSDYWDGETSQADLNVNTSNTSNSSDYWDNLDIPTDLNDLLTLDCNNITGTTGDNICTVTDTNISNCSVSNSCNNIVYDNNQSDLNVNRSLFWDNLNTPSDINAADITDDGTYLPIVGGTMSGNITYPANNGTCFGGCGNSSIYWNGTALIIRVN